MDTYNVQPTEGVDDEATRRATEEMVRVMSQNPKFRDSEFFDFMQKVATGELKFENNEVVQGVRFPLPQGSFATLFPIHAHAPYALSSSTPACN